MPKSASVVATVVAVVATSEPVELAPEPVEPPRKRAPKRSAKRGNGEGTITPVKSAAGKVTGYRVAVPTGGTDAKGRPERVWRRARTHDDAVRIKNELTTDSARGALAANSRETVAGFFAEWLDGIVQPRVAPATEEMYRAAFRLHIEPALGRKRLREVTTADVGKLLAKMATAEAVGRVYAPKPEKERTGSTPGPKPKDRPASEPKAPRTYSRRSIEVVRAVLRMGFRHALAERMVGFDPVAGTRIPSVARRAEPRRFLTPKEAGALVVAALEDPVYGPPVLFMLGTGARVSEALGLRWRDLDLTGGRATIAGVLDRSEKGNPRWRSGTKTGAGRTLHPPAFVLDALRDLDAKRLLEEHPTHPEGFVFLNLAKAPMDPSRVNKRLREMATRAALENVHPHALRHTAISLSLSVTKNLHAASRMAGHGTVKLTADLYGHVFEEAERAAGHAVGAALEGMIPKPKTPAN